MTTYTITNRPEALKSGDQVVFVLRGKKEIYEVRFQYLDNQTNYFANHSIFERLNLDAIAFALSAYGYPSSGGGWPESKPKDYPALTRLVNALYHIISEREPEQITPKAEPQPKVGDRVRVIPPAEPLVGEGVIIEDNGTLCPYRVKLDSGERFWCGSHRIELIAVPPLTPDQHLDVYLSRFASDRYRSAVKALLDMLKTLS